MYLTLLVSTLALATGVDRLSRGENSRCMVDHNRTECTVELVTPETFPLPEGKLEVRVDRWTDDLGHDLFKKSRQAPGVKLYGKSWKKSMKFTVNADAIPHVDAQSLIVEGLVLTPGGKRPFKASIVTGKTDAWRAVHLPPGFFLMKQHNICVALPDGSRCTIALGLGQGLVAFDGIEDTFLTRWVDDRGTDLLSGQQIKMPVWGGGESRSIMGRIVSSRVSDPKATSMTIEGRFKVAVDKQDGRRAVQQEVPFSYSGKIMRKEIDGASARDIFEGPLDFIKGETNSK